MLLTYWNPLMFGLRMMGQTRKSRDRPEDRLSGLARPRVTPSVGRVDCEKQDAGWLYQIVLGSCAPREGHLAQHCLMQQMSMLDCLTTVCWEQNYSAPPHCIY